jgi:uncharacterized protein with HEPN domain
MIIHQYKLLNYERVYMSIQYDIMQVELEAKPFM